MRDIPVEIEDALAEAREKYNATTHCEVGGKHIKIFINGRMTTVISKGCRGKGDKPFHNNLTAIRRACKGIIKTRGAQEVECAQSS